MKKSIIFNGHFVQVFPPGGIIGAGGHKTTDLLMIFYWPPLSLHPFYTPAYPV